MSFNMIAKKSNVFYKFNEKINFSWLKLTIKNRNNYSKGEKFDKDIAAVSGSALWIFLTHKISFSYLF